MLWCSCSLATTPARGTRAAAGRREVARLIVDDYDAPRRKLRVLGKGDKVVLLTVPMNTVRAIEQYVAQLRSIAPEAPLIQSIARPGRGVAPQTIYWIITRVAERAGVRTWPHALEIVQLCAHSHASMMAASLAEASSALNGGSWGRRYPPS